MAVGVAIVDLRSSVAGDRHPDLARVREFLAKSASPAQMAWGDEVEAIWPKSVAVWSVYRGVRKILDDRFAMGVGFGALTVPPLEVAPGVHELNGTAFKAARESLEVAKGMKGGHIALAFGVHGRPDLTRALNGYTAMLNAFFARMSTTQRRYAQDALLGLSQSETAKRHGVGQPTVQVVLKRARMGVLGPFEDGFGGLLEAVAREVGWGEGLAP